MTLANLVRVQRTAARADERPNSCALLAPGQATNRRASQCRARDRQLVTMFLPERSMTSMITNARYSSLRHCRSWQREFEGSKNQQTQ